VGEPKIEIEFRKIVLAGGGGNGSGTHCNPTDTIRMFFTNTFHGIRKGFLGF
jgi:hypothetical protein